MKKYFSILAFIFYNFLYFNTLANDLNKPTEPKNSYKILSREGKKNHYTLNKEYLKEIFILKPEKSQIELEIPSYPVKNENFNITRINSSNSDELSYKINDLNNKSVGELNITQDNCKISLNYGDKKINLESDLSGNESYNKKVFKLIEKQRPTKYFKLNKDVLKELYDSEYEDFMLEMPISENKYETFYLKKNKNNFAIMSSRKDENYNDKKYKGVSYTVNFFGEKLGNLNLYESSLDFNIDFLDKNITIENLETGKLKCVSASNSSSENDLKNIGELINKFDKISKERINNNKKLSEKKYYKDFEGDNNLEIKIENQAKSIKEESNNNQNKIEPLDNKDSDNNEIELKKPIRINVASTDLDNLSIKIKEKIVESNKANAPPPPTIAFNDRNCQRVLVNVEVSYDHWIKMQPQNQSDLYALTASKGRPFRTFNNELSDGRIFTEDMLGKYVYQYDGAKSTYNTIVSRYGWDTSVTFTQQEAITYGFTNPAWDVNQPETQKLIKRAFIRNRNYVQNRIRSYLNRAIAVFDAEGIAVGIGDVYINYQDNMKIRTRVADSYVRGPSNTAACGQLQSGQICRDNTDNRPQKIWFNQYTGMYQKQRYGEGSIWEGFEYALSNSLIALILGSNFSLVEFLKAVGVGVLTIIDILWYAYEAIADPEPYGECTRFIVPSIDDSYFMNRNLDKSFQLITGPFTIGQSWKNIVTPGMEDAVIDRLTNAFGGKICFPRKNRDTLYSIGPDILDTIVISAPIWREGIQVYVGDRIPYYDNEYPNDNNFTQPYRHEQYIRAFTSTEEHGSFLDQTYDELNDRSESHPFLNDEMPTFNHENYLPIYSNMKNTFGEGIVNNNFIIGNHLKDIGTVIPFLSTPWASYNENNALDLTIRGFDKVCRPYEANFNLNISILPLFGDLTYYTTDYNRLNPNSPYLPVSGNRWNLVDHQELYGEWYEYGNTSYPPYNIQKWNEWMFVYAIAQSLGARYFTTETNPNTILSPLARNLNYDESNYDFKTGTPRLHSMYGGQSQFRTGAYGQSLDAPNTWFEWYVEGLAEDGFFVFADFTNPGDYDMDGDVGGYDYVVIAVQLGYSIYKSFQDYNAEIAQSGQNNNDPNYTGPTKFNQLTKKQKKERAQKIQSGKCYYNSTKAKAIASVKTFLKAGITPYLIGLGARHAYRLWERGYKVKFNIDNICDEDNFLTSYPDVYSSKSLTFCGETQPDDWCGTSRPFGQKDYDIRYSYYDLGLRDGTQKQYKVLSGPRREGIQDGKPFSSVDMISWGKGFDRLTGDLIRLNMTNFAVSGQNPYFDAQNGEQVHLTNHFRLEPLANATLFPFYGFQLPYARMFIPTLEYVEGDTIRVSTDNLNVRQSFRPDFNRSNSKSLAQGSQPPNQIPNRITYADTGMTFRWSFTSLNNQFVPVTTVISDSMSAKVAAPIYRQTSGLNIDSLYGIYPLTLYTYNTPGCESNPATKFIKVHPRKLLPVTENFNRWWSASNGDKKALKGWDFKNIWSSADGLADRPQAYPSQAGQRGFYLRNSDFVSDRRMSSGTGWGTSEYQTDNLSGRNWTALVYTPMEMDEGDKDKEYLYFDESQNIRGSIQPQTSNFDFENKSLASPFKNWFTKKTAFSNLTRPVFTNGLQHSANSTPYKYWPGRAYKFHGKYNYWRSGTSDTARSPIYTNSDVNNNILYLKFDISNYIPLEAPITVGVNRCLGQGNCAETYGYTISNGSQVLALQNKNEGGGNAMGIAKTVTVGEHINGLGFKETYNSIFSNGTEWNQFLNNQTITMPYEYKIPSNQEYACRQSDARPLQGGKAKCKVIYEDISDTLFIYGRFGLTSPLVLLKKIGGADLNTTRRLGPNNMNLRTDWDYANVWDNNTNYELLETNNKPSNQAFAIGNPRLSYNYLKVKHTPRPTFDSREWRSIMIELRQYDTCRTMQFNFVYKNGKGQRFDEYGRVRNFSAHSPLYIANMQVRGSIYLPLGGTGAEVSVDSAIQGCDKKAVYKLKVSAGHNANKYEVYLRGYDQPSGGYTNIKVKEGLINNTFSFIDSTYSPNAAFEIIDSVQNLRRGTVYEIYALLINNEGFTAIDTFRTNSAQTIVDCPLFRMANIGVLTSDSGFSFKNRDNNYTLYAKFPKGNNVATFQLFERKEPSTVWTPVGPISTMPPIEFQYDGTAIYGMYPFQNKPNGKYYYRLELKNPSSEVYPNFVYSNQTFINQCFGCGTLKAATLVPEPPQSQPDPLTGQFALKISLERFHNAKRFELYERKINNPNEDFAYNPYNSAQLGNKILTFNLPNNDAFSYVQTFLTHLPGFYYYAVKVFDVNNEMLLTSGLKVLYPERTLSYCGPYLPDVYQSSNLTSSASGISSFINRLSFYLNPSCPGNKYKIYAYKLKNYENFSATNPDLLQYQLDLLPREQPIELFGTGQYISITQQERTATSPFQLNLSTNGYFNREISPKLTSLDRWYAFDFICVSCTDGDNKRTIYKYLKKSTTGEN